MKIKNKKSLPKCLDCNKQLTNYKAVRCNSCKMKELWKNKNYRKNFITKISGTNHPSYGIREKESPAYKHGNYCKDKEHFCIDCRIKISPQAKRCQHCNCSGKRSNFYGKPSRTAGSKGQRIYYKNICFRSSYESAYAKYLDKNKIEWEYEKKTFKLPNGTTYTPDFYLPKSDKYVEIKGWLSDIAKNKIKLFRKSYNLSFQLIQKVKLVSLGLIPKWDKKIRRNPANNY